MAQCHAERRKHPNAMDFYVGTLHSKLHNSSRDGNKYPHWPSYNNATPVGYTHLAQRFRDEQSRRPVCSGSFCESALAVKPSVELSSSGNATEPHGKIVDATLVQSVYPPHDSNGTTAKAPTYQSNEVSTGKGTKLTSTKVSNVMNLKVENNDPCVFARGTTCRPSQLPAREIKPLNADPSLLSSNGITTRAPAGVQVSEKSCGDLDGKNGSAKRPIYSDQVKDSPRIYKSAELGVSFTNKGALRTGGFDAGSRLCKSGEQIVPKNSTNAGNLKESSIGGLFVGSQRVGAPGSRDSSSSIGGSTTTAINEGERWPSGGSNGSDSSFPAGESSTLNNGGRKACPFISGSSDGGSSMVKEVSKSSSVGGYVDSSSCSLTAKDGGRLQSTGSVVSNKDAHVTAASVRGMGNILAGNAKLSLSKAGCSDNKIGDCPLKKSEDLVPSTTNANGRGFLSPISGADGAPHRNLGNLCTGNWSSSVSSSNTSNHGMAMKSHNYPGEELRSGCEVIDPEDIKNAGNEQYRMGHFLEAVALYDKSIAMRPTHAPYRSNRAAALSGLGRLAEAVLECEEAIKLDPWYSRAHQRAGHLYLRLGLIESAKRHLQAAGLLDNTKEAQTLQMIQRHISRCIESRKVGDWRTVLRESNAAVVAGADSAPQVLGYKSEALLKLHRLQEAEGVCAAAQRHEHPLHKLGVAPADSFLYMLQANIEMSLGRFESAIGAAEVAVKIDPRNLDAIGLLKKLHAVGHTRTLGNELFKAGRHFEACAAYGEGLESDPTNAVLLCNRAACRSKLGQWEKAVEDCDAALIAQPHYIKALMRRAHCSTKLERWEDALRDYEVLRAEMPNDTEVARGYFDVEVALKKSKGEEIHKMKFGGDVEEVFNEDHFKHVVNRPGLSVVQFVTRCSDRCCQISPFMDKLCKRFPCVHFVKVDVEDNPCIAKNESVTFIPTFKIYKSGQKVKELLGPIEQALEHAVKHYSL